eukprot:9764236-Alexandrium_andersonii.AAC.1
MCIRDSIVLEQRRLPARGPPTPARLPPQPGNPRAYPTLRRQTQTPGRARASSQTGAPPAEVLSQGYGPTRTHAH